MCICRYERKDVYAYMVLLNVHGKIKYNNPKSKRKKKVKHHTKEEN